VDRMSTWIHADADRRELRALPYIAAGDMQISVDPSAQLIDNTWSVTLPEDVWAAQPILEGHFVYCPGTEWGGPVTLIRHSTAEGSVTLRGPTWRGLLFQRRISPPAGEAYLVLTEEANALIRAVVGTSFGSLFTVSTADTGVTVSAKYRYQTMAQGLQGSLDAVGLRLAVAYDAAAKTARLSAEPISDLTGTVEISQDYDVDFTSQLGNEELANHCLILGGGELAERTVLNLYRVGDTVYTERPETLEPEDMRTVLLDYPNAESESQLIRSGVDRLLQTGPVQSLTVDELRLGVDLLPGDRIPVRDRLTGLSAVSQVSGKILTIQDGFVRVSATVSVLGLGGDSGGGGGGGGDDPAALPKYAAGTIIRGTCAAGTTTDFAVTFPKALASIPVVVANIYQASATPDLYVNRVKDVTTSGCTIQLYNANASDRNLGSSRSIAWVAVCP